MSVTVRRYRKGGWEVDIFYRLPNGTRHRERCKAPVNSKSAAKRWGEDRERHLSTHGPTVQKEEVPTLEDFADRFIEGYACANRQKPSGIAAKKMILRVYLIPAFGRRRLDEITNEHIQQLKSQLTTKSAKTVNNVLTVLSVLLKTAVDWGVIDRMPCSIKMLPIQKRSAAFHDFDEYERLVDASQRIDRQSHLIVLLGGEAGLRCGEMIALEWADADLDRRQLCVQRSDWNGQVGTPKGGRIRYVRLTRRVTKALSEHRHERSERVLCQDDGKPFTRQIVQNRMRLASRRANVRKGVHILRHTFCSRLAMKGAAAKAIQELAGHADLTMTQRYMHVSPAALDAAIELLDASARPTGSGDGVETAVHA